MIPLRDDTRRTGTPVVNVLLIALNAVFFFYELSLGPRLNAFVMSAAFVPAKLTAGGLGLHDLKPGVETALLSMFLHGGWAHFLGNMLFLWIFGDNVEDRLGHVRYLIFYLGCGFVAAYTHALANPHSTMPAVGASGAIAGVLGAYLFLYPRARILSIVTLGFFFRTVAVPALLYLP
ncbi:MAG TPA: rhomboid family intramembrane serine protease, partial [Thermoanaerobaculia bacterium]